MCSGCDCTWHATVSCMSGMCAVSHVHTKSMLGVD